MVNPHNLAPVQHPVAFYGNTSDAPPHPVVLAGKQYRLPTTAIDDIPPFIIRPPPPSVFSTRPPLQPPLPAPAVAGGQGHSRGGVAAVHMVNTPLGQVAVGVPEPLQVFSYAPPPPRREVLEMWLSQSQHGVCVCVGGGGGGYKCVYMDTIHKHVHT